MANLTWIIISRNDDYVSLKLSYTFSGKEVVPKNYSLVSFNYSKVLFLSVSVLTGMAYMDGVSQGIIGLWSEPLPNTGQNLTFGTVNIGGVSYNVSGTVGGPANDGVEPVSVNGKIFSQNLEQYWLYDDDFVLPLPHYVWAGSNFTTPVTPGQPAYRNLPPSPFLDYYNGLPTGLDIPEYPVSATVCSPSGNSTTGCRLTTFSMAFGQDLRTVAGEMYLVSTNIPLLPTPTTTQPAFGPYEIVGVASVVLVGGSIALYVKIRKSKEPGRQRKTVE